MKHYLIVGASDSVGSLVASKLAAQGAFVHALTSKPERARQVEGNIRWIYADLKSGQGVAEAFVGVDRAFIFAPPGYVPQNEIISPLIQGAVRNKLEKIVLLTALGANAVDTAPLRVAELELERSGLAYNIVRPNWFMQNFNTFWIQGINEHNKILLPTGKAKGSFIDVRDIADVVVRLISTDDLNNQAFEITGNQSLDHDEVAELLTGWSWPGAVVQFVAANGRTWQETCRSGEKLDSRSRTTALAFRGQPANGGFHFFPVTP